MIDGTHLLRQLTSFLGRVQDLVVEHREIQGQTQSDGMRGLHLGLGDLKGLLIGLLRVFQHLGAVIARGHLSQIPKNKASVSQTTLTKPLEQTLSPVVIALHFEIEDLALGITGLGDEELVQER